MKPGMRSSAEKHPAKKRKDNSTKGGVIEEIITETVALTSIAALFYGAAYLQMKSLNKTVKKKGEEYAKKVISEKKGPIKNGMPTLLRPETTEEVIKNTNPLWKEPAGSGKQNCTSCVVAAYLREQGYDVNAKPFGVIGADTTKEYRKFIKNFDDVTTKTVIRNQEQAKAKILSITNGKDGKGAYNIWWKYGGGHIFNWKVENGEVIFYDVQPAGQKTNFNYYFDNMNKTRESIIYRFDTADWDWEKVKDYIYG